MSELAEGARLEIVCAAKSGTEGSNPSLSAIKFPGILECWNAGCDGIRPILVSITLIRN